MRLRFRDAGIGPASSCCTVRGLPLIVALLALSPRAGFLWRASVQASVAEPGALGLLALARVGLALRRRRAA